MRQDEKPVRPNEDDPNEEEPNDAEEEDDDTREGGQVSRDSEERDIETANLPMLVVPMMSPNSPKKEDIPMSTIMRVIDSLPDQDRGGTGASTGRESEESDVKKAKLSTVLVPLKSPNSSKKEEMRMSTVMKGIDSSPDQAQGEGQRQQEENGDPATASEEEAGLPSLLMAIEGLEPSEPGDSLGPGAHALRPLIPERPVLPPVRPVPPAEPDPRPSTPTVPEGFLVTPDDDAEIAHVQPAREVVEGRRLEEPTVNQPESKQGGWCFLLWLLAACGMGLLLLFLFASNSDEVPEPNVPEQGIPEQDIQCQSYAPFQEGLILYITSRMTDQSHPYCLANKWMMQDPKLDSYSPEQQRQRFDLVSFYYHLNGTNWHHNDHWLSYDVPECDWWSQTAKEHNQYDDYPVCDENGTMLKLNLNSNNLEGTAPNVQGGMLPRLRTWDIGNNKIEGAFLPTHMGELEVYVINNNKFEGPMITYGGYSQFKVRVIRLDGNKLIGDHYGPLFTLMPDLKFHNISFNDFGGIISTNYGLYCKKLTHSSFKNNNKIGPIPSETGLLRDLVEFDVSGNIGLNETIPTELGQLTNLQLLHIDGTSIHGPVPDPLCDMIRNGKLDFRANCTLVDCCQ